MPTSKLPWSKSNRSRVSLGSFTEHSSSHSSVTDSLPRYQSQAEQSHRQFHGTPSQSPSQNSSSQWSSERASIHVSGTVYEPEASPVARKASHHRYPHSAHSSQPTTYSQELKKSLRSRLGLGHSSKDNSAQSHSSTTRGLGRRISVRKHELGSSGQQYQPCDSQQQWSQPGNSEARLPASNEVNLSDLDPFLQREELLHELPAQNNSRTQEYPQSAPQYQNQDYRVQGQYQVQQQYHEGQQAAQYPDYSSNTQRHSDQTYRPFSSATGTSRPASQASKAQPQDLTQSGSYYPQHSPPQQQGTAFPEQFQEEGHSDHRYQTQESAVSGLEEQHLQPSRSHTSETYPYPDYVQQSQFQSPDNQGQEGPREQPLGNMAPPQGRNVLSKSNAPGSLSREPSALSQGPTQPPTPGVSSFGTNVVPPGSQGQPYRGDKSGRQDAEVGRATPPPKSVNDMTDEELQTLIKDHEILREKYQKVKRYFFDQQNQVHQLQNTLAHQRLSLSRTSLDDGEYAARFNRLDGLIAQLSFSIRKDWRSIPTWLQPAVNKDAVSIGKQEMTAVGRAFISAWLVEEIFDKYFHPDLEAGLSTQLKVIQSNIRKFSAIPQSSEEDDSLQAKMINWRLATLEGLADVLSSSQAITNRQRLTEMLNEKLIASLQMHLVDPPPPDLNGGVPMIVELAVNVASHLPLESRDVLIEYFHPGTPIPPDIAKIESGIPPLTNPISSELNLGSDAGEQTGLSSGESHDHDDPQQQQPPPATGTKEPEKASRSSKFMNNLMGGSRKAVPTAHQTQTQTPSGGNNSNKEDQNQGPDPKGVSSGESQAGLTQQQQQQQSQQQQQQQSPARVRLAVGVAARVRGKVVLVKAPVFQA